jgi:hypothetical protein
VTRKEAHRAEMAARKVRRSALTSDVIIVTHKEAQALRSAAYRALEKTRNMLIAAGEDPRQARIPHLALPPMLIQGRDYAAERRAAQAQAGGF